MWLLCVHYTIMNCIFFLWKIFPFCVIITLCISHFLICTKMSTRKICFWLIRWLWMPTVSFNIHQILIIGFHWFTRFFYHVIYVLKMILRTAFPAHNQTLADAGQHSFLYLLDWINYYYYYLYYYYNSNLIKLFTFYFRQHQYFAFLRCVDLGSEKVVSLNGFLKK